MKKNPTVILFDLWQTLGYSLDRKPIHVVLKILGHSIVQSGEQNHCSSCARRRPCGGTVSASNE